ncbi:calcium-binding protein [Dictyobacter arantiisoli]|uniref:calcium-binding protein n=1 Tax=Dictyobacter arantiisoli TaxID=2014874 RepID=UPI001F2F45E9|nr:calcium-binding protein [Dictyobacter arantiisoli]
MQEYQRGPMRQGTRITVLAISSRDEMYGTTVMVKMKKQGVSELSLCDLKATDAPIKTQQLVEDYAMWFANR